MEITITLNEKSLASLLDRHLQFIIKDLENYCGADEAPEDRDLNLLKTIGDWKKTGYVRQPPLSILFKES